VLTPRHLILYEIIRSVIQSPAVIFLPGGASTNGTIARDDRKGAGICPFVKSGRLINPCGALIRRAAKGAVGRDREARKRSLGCGRGGGKRGGENSSFF